MGRIIDCPQDIEFEVSGVDAKLSFKEFLTAALNQYEPFGQGISNMRQAAKIFDLVDSMNGTLALEDADFKVVEAAAEKAKFNPAVGRYLVGFHEAISKSQDVKLTTAEKK